MAASVRPSPGSKSDKIWRDAIHRAVKRCVEGAKDTRLEKLADALVASGLDGDVSALKEIGDRLDGKPAQALEHTGKDGGPLVVSWLSGS